jgi:hypothetical protein
MQHMMASQEACHFLVFFSSAEDDNEFVNPSSPLGFFPQMQKMMTSL